MSKLMDAIRSRGLTIDEIVDLMPKDIPHSTIKCVDEHAKFFHKLTQQKGSKLRKSN